MLFSLTKVQSVAHELRSTLLERDMSPTEKILAAGFVLQLLIVQFVKKANRDNAHIQVHAITTDLVRDGNNAPSVVRI